MASSFRCGVVGNPVSHSLTPQLFALVHSHLGLDWPQPERLEAKTPSDIVQYFRCTPEVPSAELRGLVDTVTSSVKSAEEMYTPYGETYIDSSQIQVVKVDGDLPNQQMWFSITSPLKHQVPQGPFNSLNADAEGICCANTDGWGVVQLARHFGVMADEGALLSLKGGGSSALASAEAWSAVGGKLRLVDGRRQLPESFGCDASDGERVDLKIDFDLHPARVPTSSTVSELELIPSYSSSFVSTEGLLDGRWLLIFQHLLAWGALFCPEKAGDLPGAGLLFNRLISLELECTNRCIEFV